MFTPRILGIDDVLFVAIGFVVAVHAGFYLGRIYERILGRKR